MKIKVCGMKYEDNIRELEALDPDYIGFLLYRGSKRYVEGLLPTVKQGVKKVGVFVNEKVSEIVAQVKKNGLHAVQLHGEENPDELKQLKEIFGDSDLSIIKAFPVGNFMDWDKVKAYEPFCDFFLFDAKGKDRGGNEFCFDWEVLNAYSLNKPFFLSGGIGPDDLDRLEEFSRSEKADLCHAIDVNSRFEVSPGRKDIEKLRKFIEKFKAIRS